MKKREEETDTTENISIVSRYEMLLMLENWLEWQQVCGTDYGKIDDFSLLKMKLSKVSQGIGQEIHTQHNMVVQPKKRKGRVIAVGTTVTRTLESVFVQKKQISPMVGQTDIFIREGFTFKVIDGLLTNFHLPKSSLLMLVGAISGRERILQIYEQAVEENYRFFSYGDAMLLLP